MGKLRKITSLSTLGAVHFTDANHRTEVNTKKTRKAVQKGNAQAAGAAGAALAQQQQMMFAQERHAYDAAQQVRHALWVAEQQAQLEERARRLHAIQPTAALAPTPTATATTIVDQLRQIAEMREQGILTEAEFIAAKSRVLGHAPAPSAPAELPQPARIRTPRIGVRTSL